MGLFDPMRLTSTLTHSETRSNGKKRVTPHSPEL